MGLRANPNKIFLFNVVGIKKDKKKIKFLNLFIHYFQETFLQLFLFS